MAAASFAEGIDFRYQYGFDTEASCAWGHRSIDTPARHKLEHESRRRIVTAPHSLLPRSISGERLLIQKTFGLYWKVFSKGGKGRKSPCRWKLRNNKLTYYLYHAPNFLEDVRFSVKGEVPDLARGFEGRLGYALHNRTQEDQDGNGAGELRMKWMGDIML